MRERLIMIERELFFTTKSDTNLHRFNLALNAGQKKNLDKYHQSVQKSAATGKLATSL